MAASKGLQSFGPMKLFHISDLGYTPIRLRSGTKRAADKGWSQPSYSPDLGEHPEQERWGLRCGDKGLIAIDIDCHNAKDPERFERAVFKAIEESGFPIDKMLKQRTMSSGVHLLFRTDKALRNEKLAFNSNGVTTIETRGAGGYIVVYDDRLWSGLESLPVTSLSDQVKLYQVLRSFDQKPKPTVKQDGKDPVAMLQYMVGQGWRVSGETATEYHLVRPGATENAKSAVVYKDSGSIYVWTTSTSLPAGQAMNLSQVQSYLEPMVYSYFSQENTSSTSSFKRYSVDDILESGKRPRPPKLFDSMFRPGELTFLFSPAGVGKSTLGLGICIHCAQGTSYHEQYLANESSASPVLIVDLENGIEVYEERLKRGFPNQENFHLCLPEERALDVRDPQRFLELIRIEQKRTGARKLFIDNASSFYVESEKKSAVIQVVVPLHEFAKSTKCAVLVAAHTAKRPAFEPINLNDLAGSAQFGNTADHVMALNKTSRKGQVYLKECKSRQTAMKYDDQVIILEHADTPYGLGFEAIGLGEEEELLSPLKLSKKERDDQVIELYLEGLTYRDIGLQVGCSKSTVGEVIARWKAENGA